MKSAHQSRFLQSASLLAVMFLINAHVGAVTTITVVAPLGSSSFFEDQHSAIQRGTAVTHDQLLSSMLSSRFVLESKLRV